MTTDEKIDLIFEKVSGIETKVTGIETRVTRIETDIVDMKASIGQLQRNDEFILDEIGRVHTILDKHKQDKKVHTA